MYAATLTSVSCLVNNLRLIPDDALCKDLQLKPSSSSPLTVYYYLYYLPRRRLIHSNCHTLLQRVLSLLTLTTIHTTWRNAELDLNVIIAISKYSSDILIYLLPFDLFDVCIF